ncbi:hypothetical protein [Hyphomonas johnsonii]|uniref:Uncharacterized protein n=1 Tax=Hyphomonas johnsonii MHS-2 TaxID=1280950 RepID=A0A059FFJ5_9PROT|nr:hypothetical protein [Hyphomonas johnsonii]KCZ89405.1 hypothetical protein HJO_14342 [Hyphomonas johnsonii MHS-2]
MRALVFSGMLCLAGCGGPATPTPPPSDTRPPIASTDFALIPCAPETAPQPCVLVMAGGKRLLFGTPAGAARNLLAADRVGLDAVMLFSLRSADIEGLDEVRNAVWQAGHEGPLRVSGPAGTASVLSAINKAYETADSFTFVEDPPAGGFNAATLVPLPGERDTKARVFDTGDLIVTHLVNDSGRVGYWVDYNGVRVVLEPCGMSQASYFSEAPRRVVSCGDAGDSWPVEAVTFVDQAPPPGPTDAG